MSALIPLIGMVMLVPLIGMVMLVAGCSTYQSHPLDPLASSVQLEARRLDNSLLQAFINNANLPANAASWNLDKLTLVALYYHPDISLARAQAEAADAAAVTAGQRPNPSLSVTPTWVSNLASAPPWLFASILSIPIETAGKRGYRIDRSRHLTDAASLRIADAAWLVRGRLRLALLDVYAVREAVRLLQKQLWLEQAIYLQLQQQQSVGEIAGTDLLVAQLGQQQARLALTAAQKKQADSEVLLAAALGVPVAALVDISLDFSEFTQLPDLNPSATGLLQALALRQRPDVLASLADYAAAQSALQLEIANQYPNFQLNPGYTFNTGEHRWSLGAGSIPLPVFNQNQGPIAEMTAKRQEAAQRFVALQLRIMGEIERAHANALAMHTRWQAAMQVLQNRAVNLKLAQALLQAGELDSHAVHVAELELLLAERGRLDVLVECQQTLASLEAALRQPLSPVMATVLSAPALRKSPE